MCVSCGELITITDIYPDGECGYYYVEFSTATGAVHVEVINWTLQNLGGGNYMVDDAICGESVTIQLINDQDCVSASKTITYNCCGTPCTIQTVEIDTATCDGNRIYSIVTEKGECTLSAYAIDSPSNTTLWNDIVDDIIGILNGETCGGVNGCCSFGDVVVSWSNVGDLVTITIENSPLQFSHLVISGAPCAGNINFTHTNC